VKAAAKPKLKAEPARKRTTTATAAVAAPAAKPRKARKA
jgi:hypothetical protein